MSVEAEGDRELALEGARESRRLAGLFRCERKAGPETGAQGGSGPAEEPQDPWHH